MRTVISRCDREAIDCSREPGVTLAKRWPSCARSTRSATGRRPALAPPPRPRDRFHRWRRRRLTSPSATHRSPVSRSVPAIAPQRTGSASPPLVGPLGFARRREETSVWRTPGALPCAGSTPAFMRPRGCHSGLFVPPRECECSAVGLVRRMVSGRDTGSAGAACAVGGGSACGRATVHRRGLLAAAQRRDVGDTRPMSALSGTHDSGTRPATLIIGRQGDFDRTGHAAGWREPVTRWPLRARCARGPSGGSKLAPLRDALGPG